MNLDYVVKLREIIPYNKKGKRSTIIGYVVTKHEKRVAEIYRETVTKLKYELNRWE